MRDTTIGRYAYPVRAILIAAVVGALTAIGLVLFIVPAHAAKAACHTTVWTPEHPAQVCP
jgi:hypothetical protein